MESYQLHSFNSIISDFKHSGGSNIVTHSDPLQVNDNGNGKKYKLRLKFDGACALEVVRLNGGHFQNLTHLDISGNSAEKLDLRSLARLEWLCCSNNNLQVLSLSGNSITYLDCSRNNLQSISVEPVPNNLANLYMSFNRMEELPIWLWMIPDLAVVYASHNRIRQVDCKFQNSLSHLPVRELHLHCNKIEFISKDFIGRASRLKVLNLSQNLLDHLPTFGKKCNIQELFLSRNRLQDSEDKDALDFLEETTSLRRLYLAFNKIEQISDRCIGAWKNLEELILCGNRIRNLPSKISSMTNLRVLRVHSNRLENAPNLTKMPALKVVDLSHNNLRKLNLDNLISGGNLTYLDISCNERLFLNPEKLSSPKRPMNLVEVSNPRKHSKGHLHNDFPPNPPWDIGFSELPDRNQVLNVTQYRDVNLRGGKEALIGIFDGGDGGSGSKSVTKSISKIFNIERDIEDTHESSLTTLKYTLLNAMKNIRQQGNGTSGLQGVLCHLSMVEDPLLEGKHQFTLNLAMVGGIRCILVESGRKLTRLTDMDANEIYDPAGNAADDLCVSNNAEARADSIGRKMSMSSGGSSDNIPDPKMLSIDLTPSVEYLIIANQSIWQHVSESELLDELENHRLKKSVLIAKRITDMAQSHSCKQSLSLVLVRFRWYISSSKMSVCDSLATKYSIREFGPLSYGSGSSSDYSDVSNPLVSVTTPDSAIDTDRSSNGGSINDTKSNGSSGQHHHHQNHRIASLHHQNVYHLRHMNKDVEENDFSNERKVTRVHVNGNNLESNNKENPNEDMESIANTSISQMSVEQFRCWEYMLEQNTKLLFKKELDSLSKGVFARNQKHRKSVHFPYQEKIASNVQNVQAKLQSIKMPKNSTAPAPVPPPNRADNPGFYTLSKARSLTNLFGVDRSISTMDHGSTSLMIPTQHHQAPLSPPLYGTKSMKSSFPLFNNSKSTFMGSIKAASSSRGTILGGPNAAYFGSFQRLVPPPPPLPPGPQILYDHGEMHEMRNYDSLEHEGRLQKYWDDKITEL